MADEEMTVAELEESIAACRERIRNTESAIAERPDSNRSMTLNISIRKVRAELADLEHRLDEAKKREPAPDPEEEKIRAELAKNAQELEDIENVISETEDPVKLNNLNVSKRFLQMERNQLLIRLADGTRAEPENDEIAELKKANDAKSRIIEDLNFRISEMKKELSVAKAACGGNPEDSAACDETRVTITAGRLRSIQNEARKLGAENYDLKAELSETKRKMDMMHRNIGELTVHCREDDNRIRELEERCRALSGQLDTATKALRTKEEEIKGLRTYIEGSK